MIVLGTNTPFTAKLRGAPLTLLGTLLVGIKNSDTNTWVMDPTSTGVDLAGQVYTAELVTPATRGDYDVIWHSGSIRVAEHLVVTTDIVDRDLIYAEISDLVAAGNVAPTLNDTVLYKALKNAELDLDEMFLGRQVVNATGRRFDPTKMKGYQLEALRNATVAQAEYRIEQGDEWFTSGDTKIQGPDYTIERNGSGAAKLLSPVTLRHLRLGNLIPRGGRARA